MRRGGQLLRGFCARLFAAGKRVGLDTGTESVAIFHAAGLQAAFQPVSPLLAGAVSESLLVDTPPCPFLQPVITNGGRSTQAFFHITRFHPVVFLVGVMRPHPGQAIGLQFLPDRIAVGFSATAGAGLHLAYLAFSSGEVLHVVTDFMADHIRPGKVTRCAQLLELIEKAQRQIHFLIARAVKRPGGR